MPDLIADVTHEYRRCKQLCEAAMATLSDEQFFHSPGDAVNSVAVIAQHMGGNLRSRWTDFLTSDGEKPDRNRDGEFIVSEQDTRGSVMARWEAGWAALFAALAPLTDADRDKTVTIRGEPHTVQQAVVRNLSHASWHTGQILYVARLLNPNGAWLTIAPATTSPYDTAPVHSNRVVP